MQKTKIFSWGEVVYSVRVSTRARRVSLSLKRRGELTLIVPEGRSIADAEKILTTSEAWLKKNYPARRDQPVNTHTLPPITPEQEVLYKRALLRVLRGRIEHFNAHYGFLYGDVRVKQVVSHWGSCSAVGNMNFNINLIFLPHELIDYVVVHELCHLRYQHHQERFWQLVALMVPDYKERRKELRSYGNVEEG
jgi:predicted metal-dependent hydrolase